jgi:hypothetical protein
MNVNSAMSYGTAHMLYYIARQLKSCSCAREALALAARCPRGLEGQQRAGHWGGLCIYVLGYGEKARQKPPKCEVWCWPYGDRRKLTWRCKVPPSASTGRYVSRRISGAAPFCALLRTSAQKQEPVARICAQMRLCRNAHNTNCIPIGGKQTNCIPRYYTC